MTIKHVHRSSASFVLAMLVLTIATARIARPQAGPPGVFGYDFEGYRAVIERALTGQINPELPVYSDKAMKTKVGSLNGYTGAFTPQPGNDQGAIDAADAAMKRLWQAYKSGAIQAGKLDVTPASPSPNTGTSARNGNTTEATRIGDRPGAGQVAFKGTTANVVTSDGLIIDITPGGDGQPDDIKVTRPTTDVEKALGNKNSTVTIEFQRAAAHGLSKTTHGLSSTTIEVDGVKQTSGFALGGLKKNKSAMRGAESYKQEFLTEGGPVMQAAQLAMQSAKRPESADYTAAVRNVGNGI
jgi:hypothetical protein